MSEIPTKKTNPKQVATEATDLDEALAENDGANPGANASLSAGATHEEYAQGNKQVLPGIVSLPR